MVRRLKANSTAIKIRLTRSFSMGSRVNSNKTDTKRQSYSKTSYFDDSSLLKYAKKHTSE